MASEAGHVRERATRRPTTWRSSPSPPGTTGRPRARCTSTATCWRSATPSRSTCCGRAGRHLLRLAAARVHLRPRRPDPLSHAHRRRGAAARAGRAAGAARGHPAHGATICFTAPTAYRAMLEDAAGRRPASLRKCVSAGETLPRPPSRRGSSDRHPHHRRHRRHRDAAHLHLRRRRRHPPGLHRRAVPGYTACVLDEDGT
jgi:hypothetical protein